jgi:hypothetical protein
MQDILLTCQSVTFVDGYPVLRKVFRHLARTPRKYTAWVDTRMPKLARFLLFYSDGTMEEQGVYELLGNGRDAVEFLTPTGFEGGIDVVMIDAVDRRELAMRGIHFGGMGWQHA